MGLKLIGGEKYLRFSHTSRFSDGNIPENMALGISLALGGSIDVVLLAAIFISNFPEGLSSSDGLQSSGRSKGSILFLWILAVSGGTVSSAIGFTVSSYTEPEILSIALSFAAGAILVESMIPEAYEQGGASRVGLAIMAGFALAFILGNL